jgi:Domain of unknown function (DUF3328).
VNLPESDVPDVKDRTFFRTEYQAYETGLDSVHQLHCIVRPLSPISHCLLHDGNNTNGILEPSTEGLFTRILPYLRLESARDKDSHRFVFIRLLFCAIVRSSLQFFVYHKSVPLYNELTFDIHKDHCLDYLRQSIQCSADMTPVILYYEPAINMSLVSFGRFLYSKQKETAK